MCQIESLKAVPSFLISTLLFGPVVGGEAGGLEPPLKFSDLICLLEWTAVKGSYSFQVLSIIVRLCTVVLLYNLELCKGTKSYFCSAKNEKL